MTLGELFKELGGLPAGLSDKEVTDVTSDTRTVKQGSLFVCVKGASFDGHAAAAEMLGRGACAVVTERPLGLSAEIPAENPRALYPRLLSAFFGHPTRRLHLGAVTGTNGKTTTVNLCAKITRALGHKTGVIGTLGTDTGHGLTYSHDGPPTTPEPHRLYELFAQMVSEGTEYCFMEASSQALAQYRFAGERFESAAFTNLTRDHLDYHGTMENYFLAKRMLFDMCGAAVADIDDEYGRRVADYCAQQGVPCRTVSVQGEAECFTEYVKLYPDRAEAILTDKTAQKSYTMRLPMTGYYNVSNALLAALMCSQMGFELSDCLEALEKGGGVSGRLETLYSGGFTVIRDYAHTEDGLEKLLSTLKPLTKGRLIALFGAAGERDAGKRPAMGATAAKYADVLIVTTDNPRHEDMQKTIDDVVRGIPAGKEHLEFTDRWQAVNAALDMAREGDLVAFCGKGHEDYQAVGNEYLHYDERELTEQWLAKR